VGAGTGRHAVEFARRGFDVLAVDPSEPMLARARDNAREAGVEIDFAVGGFGDLGSIVERPADAVVSLGNAFIHVEGAQGARRAIEDMAGVLVPGGLLVLHFLNHDRLLDSRPRTMPARFRETPEGDRVFLRVIDYEDDRIRFEFLTLQRDQDGGWTLETRTSSHVYLSPAVVADILRDVGFAHVEMYGSHDRTPFEPGTHESVIMVARAAGPGTVG
jgi:SAM-dependent methyltransferase